MPVASNGSVHFKTTMFALVRESLSIKTGQGTDQTYWMCGSAWSFVKSLNFSTLSRRTTFNQSVSQSCSYRVVQIIKSLQDPLEVGNNLPGINDNVRKRCLEQKCCKRWRKVDRDGADITLSSRLFQMVGPAIGKARPLTVDSFTDGTSRRLVLAERRERRPGRSATRTSWLRYDGAVPWVALYMRTAVLNRTLSWARSQWRLMSASEMWSEWRRP